jgi:DNA gyrase/topoisomerase IV subunit A
MEKIREKYFTVAGKEAYYTYSNMVNEDRSIPTALEGLKPSGRRALWTLHTLGLTSKAGYMKTARAIGECLGKFHPHGDKSLHDTYVTLVQSPLSMADGSGGWGSFANPKGIAAMRYSEIRMSLYSEKVFFDKFYLPTVKLYPNYDGKEVEPLILPSLVPNLLVNGSFGIGVGVSTSNPSFTFASVVKVLIKTLTSKEPCTPKTCMDLVFTSKYEGIPVFSKDEFLRLHRTGKGKVKFVSKYTLDPKKKEMRITQFAPFGSLEKCLEKALAMKTVASVNEISDVTDKHGTILVKLRMTGSEAELKKEADRIIDQAFSAQKSYNIKVLDRELDEDKQDTKRKLRDAITPELINGWIKYRIAMEIEACQYWIIQVQKEIDYRLLLIKAVDQLEVIIKALRQKFSKDELRAYVAKHMRITSDEAEVIINLKVYQLRRLEANQLKQEIEERKKTIAGYKERIKNPATYIATQLDGFAKTFAKT